LIDEVRQLSSQNTIIDYGLGTSGNVMKIKKALISKEIIDEGGSGVRFLDPLYMSWLRDYYFKYT